MMGVVWWTAAGADVRRTVHIEAVRRDVLGWPQMPLAEDAGRVAGVVQSLWNGHLACGQGVKIVRRQEAASSVAGNKIRDLHAGRMPAGDERRAGGRADRGGGVAPCEEHPGGGQPVDRRRAVERAAGAAQVVGAQIVGQKHEHVWTTLRRRRCFGRRHATNPTTAPVTTPEEHRNRYAHCQAGNRPARRWIPIPCHATLPTRGYRSCPASPRVECGSTIMATEGEACHALTGTLPHRNVSPMQPASVRPRWPIPPLLGRTGVPTIMGGRVIHRSPMLRR